MIDFLRKNGARNITLIVIDSSGMTNILDVYHLAQVLDYRDDRQDSRRQLRYYNGEYFVWGGYSADSYRLLTIIQGLVTQLPKPSIGMVTSIFSANT